MPTQINPTASYDTFPIENVPLNGEDADITKLTDIIQDTYNRIVFLKGEQDSEKTKVSNAATKTGLDLSTSDLPSYGSGNLLTTAATLIAALETLDIGIAANTSSIGTVSAETGNSTLYDTPKFVSNGDTHHAAIEKLDDQLDVVNTSVMALSPTVSSNTDKIANIADKISPTASDPGTGLTYTSNKFVVNGERVDVSISKLDKPLFTARRINERNFKQSVLNWRDIAFGESGGTTPDNFFYDSLFNSSKIDLTNSTSNAYDNIAQTFGRDDISWTYLSLPQSIPATTNRLKMRIDGAGTLTLSVNFQGDTVSGFVDITAEDQYFTVPAGALLVVRVQGSIGAKLHSYMVLFKEV